MRVPRPSHTIRSDSLEVTVDDQSSDHLNIDLDLDRYDSDKDPDFIPETKREKKNKVKSSRKPNSAGEFIPNSNNKKAGLPKTIR